MDAREAQTNHYRALLRTFREQQSPIDVDFRNLVGVIQPGELSHSVYPYPARLLKQIPRFFLGVDDLAPTDSLTLDPFCGSGTTLVESLAAGIDSWGVDVNPFAQLLSAVKTTWIDPNKLGVLAQSVLESAKRSRSGNVPDVVNVDYWFSQPATSVLARLRAAIDKISCDDQQRRYLLVSLALTAERCSLRDLRIPVPVRRSDWFVLSTGQSAKEVWKLWVSCAQATAEAVGRTPRTGARAIVLGNNARQIEAAFGENSHKIGRRPNLVMTSPPYGAAQKYIRSCSLAIGWAGLAPATALASLEHESIGREHIVQDELNRPPILDALVAPEVDRIASANKQRGAIYSHYFHEMDAVFRQVRGVLAPGGHFVMIAGENVVAGERLRTDEILARLAVASGLVKVLHLSDRIRGRSLLTKRAGRARPLHAESVFVFQKGGE